MTPTPLFSDAPSAPHVTDDGPVAARTWPELMVGVDHPNAADAMHGALFARPDPRPPSWRVRLTEAAQEGRVEDVVALLRLGTPDEQMAFLADRSARVLLARCATGDFVRAVAACPPNGAALMHDPVFVMALLNPPPQQVSAADTARTLGAVAAVARLWPDTVAYAIGMAVDPERDDVWTLAVPQDAAVDRFVRWCENNDGALGSGMAATWGAERRPVPEVWARRQRIGGGRCSTGVTERQAAAADERLATNAADFFANHPPHDGVAAVLLRVVPDLAHALGDPGPLRTRAGLRPEHMMAVRWAAAVGTLRACERLGQWALLRNDAESAAGTLAPDEQNLADALGAWLDLPLWPSAGAADVIPNAAAANWSWIEHSPFGALPPDVVGRVLRAAAPTPDRARALMALLQLPLDIADAPRRAWTGVGACALAERLGFGGTPPTYRAALEAAGRPFCLLDDLLGTDGAGAATLFRLLSHPDGVRVFWAAAQGPIAAAWLTSEEITAVRLAQATTDHPGLWNGWRDAHGNTIAHWIAAKIGAQGRVRPPEGWIERTAELLEALLDAPNHAGVRPADLLPADLAWAWNRQVLRAGAPSEAGRTARRM